MAKMYHELASWWPLLSPPPDYEEEAAFYARELEHLEGDMRTVRLSRDFDAVFIHDAVCYMTTEPDLRMAIETAFLHCRPGGAALFAPDYVRENFCASTDHGGSDGGGRALRYLEWTWDPDPSDSTYVADYVCAMRSEDGTVRVEHDRHLEVLFSRHEWLPAGGRRLSPGAQRADGTF